ncbi:hypothetical protein B0H63DRAFT_554197 [Podospora didyma]|uniref:Uncharacterized protein n=1 Tax=Podospora didyma TaxID=330526 RepID=A0AAE0P3L9_9PEZI|nr:hypothetical protein B0H63DRAFT_554197 [Podospora didyma]
MATSAGGDDMSITARWKESLAEINIPKRGTRFTTLRCGAALWISDFIIRQLYGAIDESTSTKLIYVLPDSASTSIVLDRLADLGKDRFSAVTWEAMLSDLKHNKLRLNVIVVLDADCGRVSTTFMRVVMGLQQIWAKLELQNKSYSATAVVVTSTRASEDVFWDAGFVQRVFKNRVRQVVLRESCTPTPVFSYIGQDLKERIVDAVYQTLFFRTQAGHISHRPMNGPGTMVCVLPSELVHTSTSLISNRAIQTPTMLEIARMSNRPTNVSAFALTVQDFEGEWKAVQACDPKNKKVIFAESSMRFLPPISGAHHAILSSHIGYSYEQASSQIAEKVCQIDPVDVLRANALGQVSAWAPYSLIIRDSKIPDISENPALPPAWAQHSIETLLCLISDNEILATEKPTLKAPVQYSFVIDEMIQRLLFMGLIKVNGTLSNSTGQKWENYRLANASVVKVIEKITHGTALDLAEALLLDEIDRARTAIVKHALAALFAVSRVGPREIVAPVNDKMPGPSLSECRRLSNNGLVASMFGQGRLWETVGWLQMRQYAREDDTRRMNVKFLAQGVREYNRVFEQIMQRAGLPTTNTLPSVFTDKELIEIESALVRAWIEYLDYSPVLETKGESRMSEGVANKVCRFSVQPRRQRQAEHGSDLLTVVSSRSVSHVMVSLMQGHPGATKSDLFGKLIPRYREAIREQTRGQSPIPATKHEERPLDMASHAPYLEGPSTSATPPPPRGPRGGNPQNATRELRHNTGPSNIRMGGNAILPPVLDEEYQNYIWSKHDFGPVPPSRLKSVPGDLVHCEKVGWNVPLKMQNNSGLQQLNWYGRDPRRGDPNTGYIARVAVKPNAVEALGNTIMSLGIQHNSPAVGVSFEFESHRVFNERKQEFLALQGEASQQRPVSGLGNSASQKRSAPESPLAMREKWAKFS